MKLFRGGREGFLFFFVFFDVSIIVCGEDFSSNLAHKKTLDIVPASSRWLFLFEYRTLFALSYLLRARRAVSLSLSLFLSLFLSLSVAPSLLHVDERSAESSL